MSRQTRVITPSSESPVWRSISAFITRGLRSKEKHSVEMMLRHPERIIYTPLQLRDMTEIPIVAQTICGRFIQSIKYQLGSLKLLICWFLAVNFRFPSNPLGVRTNETRSITRSFKNRDMLKEMDVSDSWGHVPARESWRLETTCANKRR